MACRSLACAFAQSAAGLWRAAPDITHIIATLQEHRTNPDENTGNTELEYCNLWTMPRAVVEEAQPWALGRYPMSPR